MKELYSKLIKAQVELKAPKNQKNSFGKYNYRSCEDIIEAVKPILLEHGLAMTISDELVQIGDRYYVKAIVKLCDTETGQFQEVCGFAREAENKKGMDLSQITGASSSYARKYALNGMFAIDDTKDSDATNTHGKTSKKIDKQTVAAIGSFCKRSEEAKKYVFKCIKSNDSKDLYKLSESEGKDILAGIKDIVGK